MVGGTRGEHIDFNRRGFQREDGEVGRREKRKEQ